MSTLGAEALLNAETTVSAAMDNATTYCAVGGAKGARQFCTGFIASYSAAVSAIKLITIKRGGTGINGPITTPTLAIGSTDTAVSSVAFQYNIGHQGYSKTAVAAGTALAAGTIPADAWGVYRYSISAAGAVTSTAGADNFGDGYATEALAIAAVPAVPQGSADMGYVTVLTASGQPFVGGTDSLEGGASGNVATTTNYTSATVIIGTSLTTLLTLPWDFTNGPCICALPGLLHGDYNETLSATLAASGTGGTTGTVTLFTFAG